jgi:hypothetical protein
MERPEPLVPILDELRKMDADVGRSLPKVATAREEVRAKCKTLIGYVPEVKYLNAQVHGTAKLKHSGVWVTGCCKAPKEGLVPILMWWLGLWRVYHVTMSMVRVAPCF